MKVYLGGARAQVDAKAVLGSGGEAVVYDLGNCALKVFKAPEHPDYAHGAAEQAAARRRLDEHQHKLLAFPGGLSDRVISPRNIARDKAKGGFVVGFTMRKLSGAEQLYRYAEPRFRRMMATPNIGISLLRDLRGTLFELHRAGVVIGDFNDLNVMTIGDRAYVIDADSFQFGPYRCGLYTERFVDPTLCDAAASAPALVRAHNVDSDWYAFAVMAFRTLLCVDPYGGVHRPVDASTRVAHGRRSIERLTVMHPEVVYPKPAVPLAALPDDLLAYFDGVFAHDERGPMPAHLLDGLRWTRCSDCGQEHARAVCARCTARLLGARRVSVQVRGRVSATRVCDVRGSIVDAQLTDDGIAWLSWHGGEIFDSKAHGVGRTAGPAIGRSFFCFAGGAVVADVGHVRLLAAGDESDLPACEVLGTTSVLATNSNHRYWVSCGRLWRDGTLGDVAIGDVVARQTEIWVGERFGVGCYRVGDLGVAFTFSTDRTDRIGIADGVELPPFRGTTVNRWCVVGDALAWLFRAVAVKGRIVNECMVLNAAGSLVASFREDASAESWMSGAPGATAVGDALLVPTDGGVVRVQCMGMNIDLTARFPDTEPFVDESCRLLAGKAGLFVVGRQRIMRLSLC